MSNKDLFDRVVKPLVSRYHLVNRRDSVMAVSWPWFLKLCLHEADESSLPAFEMRGPHNLLSAF